MKHEIVIGINYRAIPHGHMPQTYAFEADAEMDICGGYGLSGGTRYKKSAIIEVDLPDYVVSSSKWQWPLSIPGRKSKYGSDCLCFVVCGETAKAECDSFGALDPEKLILSALNTGVYFVYPDESGEMVKEKIDYTLVRWLDW